MEVINRQLPAWVRLQAEYRTRFEQPTASGFRAGTDDGYLLGRFRLGAAVTPVRWMGVFVQLQDSRAPGIEPARATGRVRDPLDVRQAYLELGSSKERGVSLRGGRQQLAFGAQRLIGPSNWSNTARTFDALRLTVTTERFRADVFAASVVRIQPDGFNKRVDGQNIHGLYLSSEKVIPSAVFEPYALWKTAPRARSESGQLRDADIFTLGARLVGKLPKRFDYPIEMAHQGGHSSVDDVAAWAGYWIVGHTVSSAPGQPRGSLEYAYASGDRAAADGTRATFDQLYPTNHSYYGKTDVVGWRNIHSLRTALELTLRPGLKLVADHYWFRLASPADGLYSSGGSLIVPADANNQTTDVGREVDIFVTWTVTARTSVGAGYGHFFPGDFVKDHSPGGGTSLPYVFVNHVF